jgi:hypothetical protein
VLATLVAALAACSGTATTPGVGDSSGAPSQSLTAGQSQAPAGASQPTSGESGGGAALAEAANAVTDWCALLPADLVAELVPGASDPVSKEFPIGCTVSNGVQVLDVTYQGSSGAAPAAGTTTIPGLGETAWLEPGYPVDDAYLTVLLYTDPNGLGAATLYVEVAGHDSIHHGDDAVAVARAVIGQLG